MGVSSEDEAEWVVSDHPLAPLERSHILSTLECEQPCLSLNRWNALFQPLECVCAISKVEEAARLMHEAEARLQAAEDREHKV